MQIEMEVGLLLLKHLPDHVVVLALQEHVDLPEARDGHAVLLAVHAHALQGDDLARLGVPRAVDHAVRPLAHAVHLLELGHVPVGVGCVFLCCFWCKCYTM